MHIDNCLMDFVLIHKNLSLNFELEENSCLRLIDYFSDKADKNFVNIY